jgi:hypothetical protein
VLDAGVFDAASYRVGSTTDSSNHVLVNLVGVRLRLLSANGGVSSVRLDLGYPVASSALVHRQLYVSLAAGSLFDVGRQRDGTRQ